VRVLVAENDRSTLLPLSQMLEARGFEVTASRDGNEALRLFLDVEPEIVITDEVLPEIDGITVTKTIRAFAETRYTYIIMLSAKSESQHVAHGMAAGVDDFLPLPIDETHLRARLRVARRIMELQQNLHTKIDKLEAANREVRTLQGFLPICAYCKNIRQDENLWTEVENYIRERQEDVVFSHSICPECYEKHVKPMQAEFFAKSEAAVS